MSHIFICYIWQLFPKAIAGDDSSEFEPPAGGTVRSGMSWSPWGQSDSLRGFEGAPRRPAVVRPLRWRLKPLGDQPDRKEEREPPEEHGQMDRRVRHPS